MQPGELSYADELVCNYSNRSSPSLLLVLQYKFDESLANHHSTHSNIFAVAFGLAQSMETCIASYDKPQQQIVYKRTFRRG